MAPPAEQPTQADASARVAAGRLAFLVLAALTLAVYWPGLDGPFLFDDQVHIVNNSQVHIEDLSAASLRQAWHASLASFPSDRPLAMLSFGVNHALHGLSAPAFKGVNLGIHLLNGWLVFLLARVLGRLFLAGLPKTDTSPWSDRWPLLVAGLWLLAPLNFTPVLYVVQRMTGLSTLFVLLGLLVYVLGRRRMALERPGGWWLLALSPLIAAAGFPAKENAVLFPLYALVVETTLLARPALGRADRRFLTGFFLILLGLPCLLVLIKILHQPGWILAGYDVRPFGLTERLLTEARGLWFYLRLLLAPDLSQLGLQHDDFKISKGLLSPWTTLPAVLGWLAALVLALILRRRMPVPAFAVLFFLAGHTLESSVFPLEPIFEHRNYLPTFGPLFFLGYILSRRSSEAGMHKALGLVGLLLLALSAAVTYERAKDWRSMTSFIVSEVEHHPDSARANLHAARLLISSLPEAEDPKEHYRTARRYLEQVRRLAPDNLDALFGLIVLNLHAKQPPEAAWVRELKAGLRSAPVGPTRLTIGQFGYLVRWHMSGGYALPREVVLGIFDAALANPLFDDHARAAIFAAHRAYHETVLNDPASALHYARQAVAAWPERWHYQDRLGRLLVRLEHFDEARETLAKSVDRDVAGLHRQEARELEELIDRSRQLQTSSRH